MAPLQYFSLFITTALLDIFVEQTNIYSFQTINKSINTNREEMMSLIGMSIKMGMLQLLSYKSHWSRELRCQKIAVVMSLNCYQELLTYLHFVNNDSINTQDKLAKSSPLISMVQDEFVKMKPEEYNSVDKQIIPSKAKYLSINTIRLDNTIRKSQKSGDAKILFTVASLDLCMTFSFKIRKPQQG